ncbi:MAG: response regulator, partial [Bacteroidota bacterium]
FDRITEFTCKLLRAKYAFITLVDSDRHFFLSMYAHDGPVDGEREASPMYSFCQNVVVTNKRHAINNVNDGGLVCKAEVQNKFGIVAYLGTPLRTPNNERIGSLCVIENQPRTWTAEDKRLIKEAGELVVKEIALRYHANEHVRAEKDISTHIAALKEANSALALKNDELRKANAVKDNFLASMSHEIRTPMNGVIGFTSLLLDTALNPLQREYTETIRSSGEALLDIINDILDYSAIGAGKVQLNRLPFSIHTCLSEALDVISLKASSKGLEIGYVVDQNVPELLVGDARRIGQILVNLLGNAVKFTEHGEIGVHAFVDQTIKLKAGRIALHVIVSDTGIGIAQDQFEKIFELFFQVDSSNTRRFGGTGLGLSIGQSLCTSMGGVMWVESEEGKGSSFHFTLELEVAQEKDNSFKPPYQIRNKHLLVAAVSGVCKKQIQTLSEPLNNKLRFVSSNSELPGLLVGQNHVYDAVLIDLDVSDVPRSELLEMAVDLSKHTRIIFLQRLGFLLDRPLPFTPTMLNKPIKRQLFYSVLEQSFRLAQPKQHGEATNGLRLNEPGRLQILVAEDNRINSQLIMRYIQLLGHTGDYVTNGEEAIDALGKNKYDLILMDVSMPQMDGVEATERIRALEEESSGTYVIGITASIKKSTRERCMEAGMDDFISKPISLEDLREALNKIPKRD